MASNDDGKIVYNILLIGEAGVGKSTFINAFANYINFPNFNDAKSAKDINILIPTRLLDYIASRKPYDTKNSALLIKARTAIEKLKMPLADILKHIQRNIDEISTRKEQLLSGNTRDIAKIRKLLTVTGIDFRIDKFKSLMNVCTDEGCTKIYNVGDITCYEYTGNCHYSYQFREDAEAKCIICGHNRLDHMYIPYKIGWFTVKIKKAVLDRPRIDGKELEDSLKKYCQEQEKYQREKDILLQTVAKFAYYLKISAIVPNDDIYEQYLQYLIEREKQNDNLSALRMIENYKQLKAHQEQKHIWDEQLARAEASGEQIVITGADILASIEEMFKLEETGQHLKHMYETVKIHMLNRIGRSSCTSTW